MIEKRVYFVDTENVGYFWIDELPELTKDDEIYIFTTNNQAKAGKMKELLQDCSAHIEYIRNRSTGHNSMDLLIAGHMGFFARDRLYRQDENAKYIIISNDKGFDGLVDMFNERGWAQAQHIGVADQNEREFHNKVIDAVKTAGADYERVLEIAQTYPAKKDRNCLKHELIRRYKDKADDLFNAVRPHTYLLRHK